MSCFAPNQWKAAQKLLLATGPICLPLRTAAAPTWWADQQEGETMTQLKQFISKRWRTGGVVGLLTAPILVIGALSFIPASADSSLSMVELARLNQANCQVLLAKATTPAARERAIACITDQQIVINALLQLPPSPSPTPSGTASPTASPTTSPTASPTPTATPTPPSGQTDCLNQLAKCGFPNAANTGVPVGTKLIPVSGDVVVNTANTIVDRQEIHGCIVVNAPNVIVRNTRVAGDCFWGIINNSTNLVVLDTEISCGATNGTGLGSQSFTALRVEITDCENGFNVLGTAVVRDSYIHDLEDGGGAHTDGAQFNQGASTILFQHNTIISPEPGGTSAIIAWNEGNPQNANVLITGNLLAGGTYTLYCPRQNSTNFRVTNNRFGPYEYGSTDSCIPGRVAEFSGNVTDATNAPLDPA
jgi:hypothetical protein